MSAHDDTRGFTLVEVLVTVLILGLLAAVVFPVVVPQINKADPTKASNDLANLQTGIELFQLDVRPADPGDIEDLTNPIGVTDADVTGSAYNAGQVNRWEGPYLDRPVASTTVAATSSVAFFTGFDAPVMNDLYRFNSASTTTVNTDAEALNGDFVAVRILNLANDEYSLLNEQIDDDAGAGDPVDDLGKLRRDASQDSDVDANAATGDGSGFDTVAYFLAVPLR